MKNIGLIVGLLAAFGIGSCGKPPSKPKSLVSSVGSQGSTGGAEANGNPLDPNQSGGVNANFPMAVSLASFEANLYEPVLKPFCISCHEKSFVDQDPAKAHAAFLLRTGFDKFAGVDQSLPVLKMKQAHNCWDAATKTCVSMMNDKMNLWLTDLAASGFKPTPVTYPHSSSEVALTVAAPIAVNVPVGYAFAGADKGVLAVGGPFLMATDDIDGPFKSYITTPIPTVAAGNVNVAQSVTFNLDAKVAGTYFVWARVKTFAATSDELFIQAGNAVSVQFKPGITGKDTWKWAQVMIVAANGTVTTTPYSFVAAAGLQSIKVQHRENGVRLNFLVITTSPDFNGELFSNSFFDIAVPLTVPGAEGAQIIATVWEKTTDEGKKSLGVKELKIKSPVPLQIKTIYPLFNGIFSANNGTYTLVDTIAGGPDATKSVISTGGSTASTWLADLKVDKLSFAFEVLKVAP